MFSLKIVKRLNFSKLQMYVLGVVGALIWEMNSAFYLYRATLPNNLLEILIWIFIVAIAGTAVVFFISKVLLLFVGLTGQKFAWLTGFFTGTIIGILLGVMDIFSVWFCGNIDGFGMLLGNFLYLISSAFIWACCGILLAFTRFFRNSENLS